MGHPMGILYSPMGCRRRYWTTLWMLCVCVCVCVCVWILCVCISGSDVAGVRDGAAGVPTDDNDIHDGGCPHFFPHSE